MDVFIGHFKDKLTYDSKSKTALSVRDGFLEYAGYEIGKEPSDKIFKVHRSPATIGNLSTLMKNIPLTDDHVPLDAPVSNAVGSVIESEMVDLSDDKTGSNLAIKNLIDVNDDADKILNSGKRELSLGYMAELVEYEGDEYDFVQKNIVPHHLAIVDNGRCGSMCSFIDKKTIKENIEMNKYFFDKNGSLNMQETIDIVTMLPEAVKVMPMSELNKIMPKLQAIVASAGMASVAEEKDEEIEEAAAEDESLEDEKAEGAEDKAEDSADVSGEDKEEVKDEELEDEKDKKPITDSSEFKDALEKAVATRVEEHTQVIMKARDFVDHSYDFKGKTTEQIMSDTLSISNESHGFKDEELAIAFKLLKHDVSKYSNFSDDNKVCPIDALKTKEL